MTEKTFSFLVDTEGQPYNKTFSLDKNVKLVQRMALSSNMPNMLFYRGSQRIEISGDEIFPEDYESKMFMSGMAVAPDNKFKTLGNGVIAGNGEIKFQYKDTANPNAPFTSYRVIVIVQFEMQ